MGVHGRHYPALRRSPQHNAVMLGIDVASDTPPPFFLPTPMGLFFLKRSMTLLATLVGASIVVFLVLEILPGNTAQILMGPDAAPDAGGVGVLGVGEWIAARAYGRQPCLQFAGARPGARTPGADGSAGRDGNAHHHGAGAGRRGLCGGAPQPAR